MSPAITDHLLSLHRDQFLRATQHPFLKRAAQGTLPKSLAAIWLSNDKQYIQGYISTISDLLDNVRRRQAIPDAPGADPEIETRLIRWLEAGVQNGEREVKLFQQVAEDYDLDLGTHGSSLLDKHKLEGLRRYEALFSSVATRKQETPIPWLESAVLLWATEKVYYEAWSWANRQDTQIDPSSRTFERDQDGGAMRREFIPNWSNGDFLAFTEELQSAVNDGVARAVGGDDAKWEDVKRRTEAIWKAVLNAEETFWPDVPDEGE
jgi:hypothetical protein